MSENQSETPDNDPGEQGAEQAGGLDEQTEGGYGGPDPEEEVAPGFEADNKGSEA
ncbi:hypothetical protein [Arthrobacter echini]|uniref:hypothetical protein n=1 Tax=Arthrobacter echini TaxID=1529066 RepID=UPI0016520AAE|nr:hypothetical protein [Arthrobacter echini]